jgi:hypothetical protein
MARNELVRRTEADWKRIAEGHERRISTSLVEVGVGGVASAAGVALLLAQPLGEMSRTQQYNVGSALVGPGVPILSLGLRGLLQRSVEENSWSAYRVTMGRSDSNSAASVLESVSVVPLAHGAFASVTFSL